MRAGCVVVEGVGSVRRVLATASIAKEGFISNSRVAETDSVTEKRPVTNSRIGTGFGVTQNGSRPRSGIFVGSVEQECPSTGGVLKLPSRLLMSENNLTAVLYVPVVRLRRALVPPARRRINCL
jgi:hypothetical protein